MFCNSGNKVKLIGMLLLLLGWGMPAFCATPILGKTDFQVFNFNDCSPSSTGSWTFGGSYFSGACKSDPGHLATIAGDAHVTLDSTGPAWTKNASGRKALNVGNGKLSITPSLAPLMGIYSTLTSDGSGSLCYRYVFNEKLGSVDSGTVFTLGDSGAAWRFRLCYKKDSLFLQRISATGAVLTDTTAFLRSGVPRVCLNSWQPFEVEMFIEYRSSYFGAYLATALNSPNWFINIRSTNLDTPCFAIAFPASPITTFLGTLNFSQKVSDCGFIEETGSMPMSLSDMWNGYFGWHVLDSAQQTFPYIDKIIYCPPGYGSSTTISSTTTFSGTTTIGSGYDVNGSAYAALDFHVSAEAGFLGNGLSANAFDLSAKIGFNYDVNSSSSNTYNFSRALTQAFTTNNEDMVITEDRTIKSMLVQRRLLSHLLDTVAIDSTDTAKTCSFIANIPIAVSAMQPYAVSAFVSAYKSQPDVIKNFWSLYAKDTATGKLKTTYLYKGHLIQSGHSISQGVTEDGSKVTETSATYGQSFSWSAGPFAELCVEVAGVGAGGSIAAMFSNSSESSQTSDTTNVVSYHYTCPFAWDLIHTDIYEDSLFGSRLYAVDSATSFTTNPREKQTRPSVLFNYVLHKPAHVTVGQPATYTLDITNNSPKDPNGNSLLSTWHPEFDGFTVSDALSSIYSGLITFNHNDTAIAQDSTVSITVNVSSAPDTLPLVLWAHYGYRNASKVFIEANWDAISSAGATAIKHIPNSNIAKAQWAFKCESNHITYSLAQSAPVSLDIFTLNGKMVASINKSMQPAGTYIINNAIPSASKGVYLCRFRAGSFVSQSKLVLNR